jgi:LysR family transcriptional regulator, regulator for bpeEF and oprC
MNICLGRCMDRFLFMQCFVRAVETGSFSAVARELGTGQPNVSRHIASLEEHLGTRLLHRSTRRLTLTPEGERFYTESRRVLDAMSEAESTARGVDSPSGLLRVGCPTVLGRRYVLRQIQPFLQRYPHIDIDLQIADRFIDLIEEGMDLAIRIGVLKDSALRARRIGTAESICVASDAYLAKHAAPKVPNDLLQHDCIIYTLRSSGNLWSFATGAVAVSGRFRVNTPDGVHQAAIDGLGIAYAPVWLFDAALRQGTVKPLMLEHSAVPIPIHIVYPVRRLLPRRAAVFMDFISEEFDRTPELNEGAVARLANELH